MAGASADASGQSPTAATPLSFFFLFEGDASAADSLAVLTTAQPPAEVDDAAATDAAGLTGSAGGRGSAGRGAGVQDGSLEGFGVGSGAGRNGSVRGG